MSSPLFDCIHSMLPSEVTPLHLREDIFPSTDNHDNHVFPVDINVFSVDERAGRSSRPTSFLLLFQRLNLYLSTDSPVAFLNDFGVKYDHKALFDETS